MDGRGIPRLNDDKIIRINLKLSKHFNLSTTD